LLASSLAFAGGLSVAACLGRSIAALDPEYAAANGLSAHQSTVNGFSAAQSTTNGFSAHQTRTNL
jgi:hypothetical protein